MFPVKKLLINLSLCYIITKYWIQSFCQLVFFQLAKLKITVRNQIFVSLSLDGGSGEEAVSDQNIDFEDVENYSFENMFEIVNMSQMLNVLGNEL